MWFCFDENFDFSHGLELSRKHHQSTPNHKMPPTYAFLQQEGGNEKFAPSNYSALTPPPTPTPLIEGV